MVRTDVSEERIAPIFRAGESQRAYSEQVVAATCSLYARCDSPALKMGAIRSSETSVLTITTRHQIPEDDFLHRLRHENLKSYNLKIIFEKHT
jgi:hypothetical protein